MGIEAVIFDLDGVILDSEGVWHEARREFAARFGGRWTTEDQRAVMGDNSWQWAHHIRTRFAVPLTERQIIAGVVALLRQRYTRELPVVEGAREAVYGLARAFKLGLASSSPPELIRWVLHAAGLAGAFCAWASSDDVAYGKPAPDVYQVTCDRLGAKRAQTVAIEDSENGVRSAKNAGLLVVAIPNPRFAPSAEALALADMTLHSIREVTPSLIGSLSGD